MCVLFLLGVRVPSQLDDLVAQLGQTEPHYIKCIKPNSGKTPGGWTSPLVIEQLRYSGVLEVSCVAVGATEGFAGNGRKPQSRGSFSPLYCFSSEGEHRCTFLCLNYLYAYPLSSLKERWGGYGLGGENQALSVRRWVVVRKRL